jgi:Holliday junction resolvasome RuvABC endonuclease subunit
VYYEEVAAHKGTAAAHIYGGLVATLQSFCEERNIPYCGVPVGTIKRYATGKGNANKEAMIAAAQVKHGYLGDNDNEADALHLLALSLD